MNLTAPYDTPVYHDVVAVLEDRRELMRIAAQSALNRSRGGRDLDAEARAWANSWAAIKPLDRPMGTGEPMATHAEVKDLMAAAEKEAVAG